MTAIDRAILRIEAIEKELGSKTTDMLKGFDSGLSTALKILKEESESPCPKCEHWISTYCTLPVRCKHQKEFSNIKDYFEPKEQ